MGVGLFNAMVKTVEVRTGEDDTESRKDKDVDFRMTEEPEEVLVGNRVTTRLLVEEALVEGVVLEEHK